ncbi:MAG: patatin-like phospholipase family protein [Nocardiaceae bacterium]|nr:patatin-like phospholipase family protein [Nocardiaceae bacterium]
MNHSLHSRTALVLGGGGSTGNAWLIGVIAGLFDAGLDVTTADLIIGTSAGSTAAAQITGAKPTDLFTATVAAVAPQRAGSVPQAISDQMERTARLISSAQDVADMRRRLGAAILEIPDRSEQWRAIVEPRLPSSSWPNQEVLITAVDADTGDPVVFDRDSGVDIVDAVAASCSSGFAYRIGDRRYIDGGYRTNADNADLAAGYERILVLSPFGGKSRTPFEWGLHLQTQIDELRAGGSTVETIFPGSDSEHMFGLNAMDLSLRPAAARAGYDQGKAHAERFTEFWV